MALPVTLAEADAFWNETDPGGFWSTKTDPQKTGALNSAWRKIRRQNFQGEKVDINQDFEFPRFVLPFLERRIIFWDKDIGTGEAKFPEQIKEAIFTQAKLELEAKEDLGHTARRRGLSSLSILSTSESYDLTNRDFDERSGLFNEVLNILSPYLLRYL